MELTTVRAKDFMTTRVVTLTPEMEVLDAMRLFAEHRISGAPVLDRHGKVVGMLTERDCLKTALVATYHGERHCGSVAGFMSRNVHSVNADTALLDLADLFVRQKYRSYPVLKDNRLLGVVSRQDVVRTILQLAS